MDAYTRIESSFLSGIKAVCYQCPTGGGKTRIIRAITDTHHSNRFVVYIVAHRRNLVKQLSNEVAKEGIKHGIIASGNPYIRYRTQVCSIQTLIRRENLVPPSLIIVDEFHHAKSNTYMKLFQRWPNAKILGVTATPSRPDGKPLKDICQKLILGPEPSWLIEQCYLSKFRYFAPDNVDMEGVKTARGEYVTKEVLQKVNKNTITGCAVSHYKKHADHKPAIACCVTIDHAIAVAKEFREAGYKAFAIHSKMKEKEIESKIKGLKNGSVEILCQCDMIGEGVDIPGATALIMLRPTQSHVIFLQQIGRVLRLSPGKEFAIILDHVGNHTRHGMPDDSRVWTLEVRMKRDKGNLDHKRCPECFEIVRPKTARECLNCGFEWKREPRGRELIPEQKDGKLVEINKSGYRETQATIDKMTLKSIIKDKARSLKHAIAIAKKFGFKHTAAWYIWNKELRKGA